MINFIRKLWYTATKTDYVIVHCRAYWTSDSSHVVTRVYKDSRGVAYYLHNGVREINKPYEVYWPTCLPEKYMVKYYMEKNHASQ